MIDLLRKLTAMTVGFENPLPAFLDRLGVQHVPYRVRLRRGGEFELRPRSGDLFGLYEIFLRRDYFSVGQTLKPGDVVIDVGANIGCFSVLAAGMVGPTGRVLALEPDEATYRQLVRNIELNRLTNVRALRVAVGGRPGTITLHSNDNALFSSIFSSVNGRPVIGSDQQVEMTTLEALMAAHEITSCDYLKLDCEGAEHDIVATLSAATARRVAQITMEVHKVPGREGSVLFDGLKRLGYRRVGQSTLPCFARSAEDTTFSG